MQVFSGWYTHSLSTFPAKEWIGYAISKHIKWCQLNKVDYQFIASPMLKWYELCHKPEEWAYCTMIKYEAMRTFLNNERFGNIFYWMDLDIYPEDHSSIRDVLDIGSTVFLAPVHKKRCLLNYEPYECSKIFWSGLQHKEEYYMLNSGLFTMSRSTVAHFWDWLNKDYSIDTIQWWEAYRDKKVEIKRQVDDFLSHNGKVSRLDMIGTDEMLMDDWIHSTGIKFDTYPLDFFLGQNKRYTHYYGALKPDYPKI